MYELLEQRRTDKTRRDGRLVEVRREMETGAGGDTPREDRGGEGGRDKLRRGHSWRRVEGHAGRESGSEESQEWQRRSGRAARLYMHPDGERGRDKRRSRLLPLAAPSLRARVQAVKKTGGRTAKIPRFETPRVLVQGINKRRTHVFVALTSALSGPIGTLNRTTGR